MKITVNLFFGGSSYQFEVEEKTDMATLQTAITLGNPPVYCHECKNKQHFRFDSNKDKEGNVYVNVLCRSCGAKAKLGQYKSGGYFWHKFEKYMKPNGGQAPQKPATEPANAPDPTDNDLPF